MKSFTHFLLIIIVSYLAGMVMPWWSIAVAALLVSLLFPLSSGGAFFSSFFAVFALWLALAFFQDVRNDHILANRVSEIFLQRRSPILIGVVSAFIGGLVGGMGGLSGSLLRKALRRNTDTSSRRETLAK